MKVVERTLHCIIVFFLLILYHSSWVDITFFFSLYSSLLLLFKNHVFFFYFFFFFNTYCTHTIVYIVMSLEDELTVARKEVGKERDLRETMEKVREQIDIFFIFCFVLFFPIYSIIFFQETCVLLTFLVFDEINNLLKYFYIYIYIYIYFFYFFLFFKRREMLLVVSQEWHMRNGRRRLW